MSKTNSQAANVEEAPTQEPETLETTMASEAETAKAPEPEKATAPKPEKPEKAAKGTKAKVVRGGWSWGDQVLQPGDVVTASEAQIADWRAAGVVE